MALLDAETIFRFPQGISIRIQTRIGRIRFADTSTIAPVWLLPKFPTVDYAMRQPNFLKRRFSPVYRPFWRRYLLYLRLRRGRAKFLTFADYVWYLWLHFVKQPLCLRNGITKMAAIRVRAYSQPFIVRLGTTDLICLTEVIIEDEYENLLGQLPCPPGLIVDIGSNVGYTIRLFQHIFPDAMIIGIEPLPANMEICRRNILLGATKKVHLVECCIVGHAREVFLDQGMGAWAARIKVSDNGSGVIRQGRTLDDVLGSLQIANISIDILKMDIEGAEQEAILAGGDWLERVRRMAVETHPPYTAKQFIADLASTRLQFESAIEDELIFCRATGRAKLTE